MQNAPFPRTLVLADFDGTINMDDTQIMLFEAFAPDTWRALDQEWVDGNLSTPQQFELLFTPMHVTRAEMEAVLAPTRLDPGFAPLVAFLQQKGCAFAILSDGLEWAIEHLTQRSGLAGLTIYANRMLFTGEGIRLEYPWADPSAPMRGTSKPAIIRRYQAQGYRVVLLGDGVSDKEAALVANITCARGHLWEYCQQNHIAATHFERLTDLLERWQAATGDPFTTG